MTTVTCIDCSTTFEIGDASVSVALGDGSIYERIGRFGTRTYMGICEDCEPKHRHVLFNATGFEDEFVRLRQLMNATREEHPEWSLAECARAAVEVLNDPWREPNASFRAYLVERQS